MLEVATLDLGSTWVGHFDPQKIKEVFELPENIIPVVFYRLVIQTKRAFLIQIMTNALT